MWPLGNWRVVACVLHKTRGWDLLACDLKG